MKNAFLFSAILVLFYLCQENSLKKDFIGNWSRVSDGIHSQLDIDIQFFEDSTVVDNSLFIETYSTEWKINGSTIEETLLRYHGDLEQGITVNDFKFSSDKDTVYLKHANDSMPWIQFLKINNGYEYLENQIGLKIKLPKTGKNLIQIDTSQIGFNIYVSYDNGQLIAKTGYRSPANLDDLASKVFATRAMQSGNPDFVNF